MHWLVLISVAIWLYLLSGRGAFWRVRRLLLPAQAARTQPRIAAVVPARNEADVVAQSVTSLLQQNWQGALRVYLVDDASTDNTAEVAREAAARVGKSHALTVIKGEPLPAGWLGKVWALHQGIGRAREFAPDFLLLTDADIVHSPGALSSLVARAEARQCDLTSLMVKLHCCTPAEKMLIPAFVFFFLKLYPPAWISDRRRAVAGAAGGCMLLRPEALTRAGGMIAIRNEVIDDCALARAIKRSGGAVDLSLAPSSLSIRVYRSFAEIGRMIARSAFNQLHHSALMLMAALLGLVATYLAPPVLLFIGAVRSEPLTSLSGGVACVMMLIAYWPMVRFYGLHPAWALTLPFTACFYMGATFYSAVKYWLGRGGEWKGRAQDIAQRSHPQASNSKTSG